MKFLSLFCMALLFPFWCWADNLSPVNLEIGSDEKNNTECHQQDSMFRNAHGRANKKNVYFLRARSVNVENRWNGKVELPLAPGDVLTPEKISESMEALDNKITNNSVYGYSLRSKGEIGVMYIEVDYDTPQLLANTPASEKTVDVTFRPHYVQFSLINIGDNVLPIPRSSLPTFYENVPKPLLALKPTIGLFYDRLFGTATDGSLEADLLNLADPGRISQRSEEDRHLLVQTHGKKSLQERYYRIDSGITYIERHNGAMMQELSARADYVGVNEPLGSNNHIRNAGFGGAGITLKLAPNTSLSIDSGYRWTDDRMDSPTSVAGSRTIANEQLNRLLLDAIPPTIYGFLRAAVWGNSGWLNGSGGSYHHLVARLGYAKEIPLRPNETMGLELLIGAGKVWGVAPEYALFFTGNSPEQFLYDSRSSSSLLNMPAGPLVHSFGQGEAGFRIVNGGVQGGNAFWHVNLNLTYPIRWLSRALIPDERTDLMDADDKPVTLKQLLKKQIDVTGPSMLSATLRKEGMSTEEAKKKAAEILNEIKPATHFIIDDANIYSIKPLIMFDAAGMTAKGRASGATWLAAGGGVQLTVVIAKFEFGYMQTISGPTFSSRGNGFARLVFQNLF